MKQKLTWSDLEGKKANLHTHTTRCRHAIGEDREYVEAAIQAGFDVLGFSDHMPYSFDDGHTSLIRMSMRELESYVKSVETLKKEYEKDITIYLGYEAEYFKGEFERTMLMIDQYPLDYLLLGQHFLREEKGNQYAGTPRTEEIYLQQYVQQILDGLDTGRFLYVAHPDIIHYTGSEDIYRKHMGRLAKELKARQIPIEINENGFRENIQYPSKRFLDICVENGNEFLVGVDAHSPENLLDFENYKCCKQLVPQERLRYTLVFDTIQ